MGKFKIFGYVFLLLSIPIMAIPQLQGLMLLAIIFMAVGVVILVYRALKEDGFFQESKGSNAGLYCLLILGGLTVFSVFNVGYVSPYEDDESSAYLSLSNLKEDSELYKNDFYIQSIKKTPVGAFAGLKVNSFIPEGDWGQVVLFGLESSKDDLFVIPAFQGKYDYSTFRFLAKRSVFLEWKGTGQVAYDDSILPEVRNRFIDYCKVDFMLVKDRKEFVETCKYNYVNLMKEEDFKLLNVKYGADYLIENKIETARKLNLPIAWENEEFITYDLRG